MIPHTSANYRSNKSLEWVGFCYCSYRVGDRSQKRRKTVRSPVDLFFLFSFHLSQSNTWLVHYTTLPINWIMQVWNIELLPINTSHKTLQSHFVSLLITLTPCHRFAVILKLHSHTLSCANTPIYQLYGYEPLWRVCFPSNLIRDRVENSEIYLNSSNWSLSSSLHLGIVRLG